MLRRGRESGRSVGPQTKLQPEASTVEPHRFRQRAEIVFHPTAILPQRLILQCAMSLSEVNADGKSMTFPAIRALHLRPSFWEPALRLEHCAITPNQTPVTAKGVEFPQPLGFHKGPKLRRSDDLSSNRSNHGKFTPSLRRGCGGRKKGVKLVLGLDLLPFPGRVHLPPCTQQTAGFGQVECNGLMQSS